MRRETGFLRRREVDVAGALPDEMTRDTLDQFSERRVESLDVSNANRRTAPEVVRDDVEVGLPGLASLLDELSQLRPVENIEVRREPALLVQQTFESRQAE